MQSTIEFSCPFCKEKAYKKIKAFPDGVVVGECKGCKLVYTPVRHQNPSGLFEKSDLNILKVLYGPILKKKIKHYRDSIFRKYLKKVTKYTSGKKHLDVGCANGFFLNTSRDAGFDVFGVEPGLGMAEFGRKLLNLEIAHGTLDQVDLGDRKWDIITFTDSLEYFPNPVGDLKKLAENHLNDNGILFVKVPNGDYFKARHFLKAKLKLGLGEAEAFSPTMRVVHYDYRSIKSLAERINLAPIERGHFAPINSPVWNKYTGDMWLEFESPWFLGMKEKALRQILHLLGRIEFFLTRKNHFSQSVYVVAKKMPKA